MQQLWTEMLLLNRVK